MAGEKHQIPTDPITGLSYPFILLDHVPHRGDVWLDDHHLEFEHMNPLLRGQGGRAVRKSVVQYMMRWQHNLIHEWGSEPELPQNEDEQFRATVFGVARLMGPMALDLTGEEWWKPVEMTPEQYALVTDPLRMYPEDGQRLLRAQRVRNHIGRFFAAYALSRDLSHVSPKVVRQFLSTRDTVRRKELGNWLLAESIDTAVQPIKPLQREALQRRPVAGRVDLRRAVRGFFVGERFGDYYGALASRLIEFA
jgi:hypothetical protein